MAKDRALVSNDDVASVAVAATTESAPASGRAFRASLLRSIDALASDASRSDGMTAAPLALGTDEDDASLIACFDAFPDEARDEIRSAVAGRAHRAEGESAATDYRCAFVPCLVEGGCGRGCVAAAVVVERGGDDRLVWEIVWFAVRQDLRRGPRRRLFGRLRDRAARGVGTAGALDGPRALVCCASRRARARPSRAQCLAAPGGPACARTTPLRALLGRAEGATRGWPAVAAAMQAASWRRAAAGARAVLRGRSGSVRFDRRGRAAGEAGPSAGRSATASTGRITCGSRSRRTRARSPRRVVLRVDAPPAPPPGRQRAWRRRDGHSACTGAGRRSRADGGRASRACLRATRSSTSPRSSLMRERGRQQPRMRTRTASHSCSCTGRSGRGELP